MIHAAQAVNETGQETRARIAQAAISLFARNGFHGSSMREIAEIAKVTKPVLYYYFGSKEQLYVAMAEECYARCNGYLSQAIPKSGPFRKRLRKLVVEHFNYLVREEDIARMLYVVAFAPQKGAPGVNLWELEQPHMDILRGVIRDGIRDGEVRDVSQEDAALLLLGMINIHLMGLVILGEAPTEQEIEQIVSIFADGVCVR